MDDQVPPVLRQRLEKKLGVGTRAIYLRLAKIARQEFVSPRAAAFLLAGQVNVGYSQWANAADRAEMRGHVRPAAARDAEPAKTAPVSPAREPAPLRVKPAKNNTLFVVHGRDIALNESMFSFLRAIGLNPMEWSQAIAAAKGANPNVGVVINNAMKKVQGVMVMFSPDEEAKLKAKFCAPNEKNTLGKLGAQARPNVLFEAGLALGAHPKKTILVQVGNTRDISDIAGMHIPKLSQSATSRKELAQRLRKMGFKVTTEGTSWLTEGNFSR